MCLTPLIAAGGARELSVRFEKSIALMAQQIALSIPSAIRFPDGFLDEHATKADAEASMVAHLDKVDLIDSHATPLTSKMLTSKIRL